MRIRPDQGTLPRLTKRSLNVRTLRQGHAAAAPSCVMVTCLSPSVVGRLLRRPLAPSCRRSGDPGGEARPQALARLPRQRFSLGKTPGCPEMSMMAVCFFFNVKMCISPHGRRLQQLQEHGREAGPPP